MAADGRLFISIYNDQGEPSRRWLAIKRVYNGLPKMLRGPYAMAVYAPSELRSMLAHAVRMKLPAYFSRIRNYASQSLRGMSWYYDKIDWIGGYPFEVAKPEEVLNLYLRERFQLTRLKTCAGGLGCNEFVFERR